MTLKYFKLSEFDCAHTGKNEMDKQFLHLLDYCREECGFPFLITSGYRDKTHPIEVSKTVTGTHNQGIAADIACYGSDKRYKIVYKALELGFTGIGVAKTFIHLDTRKSTPAIWTYNDSD